MAASGLRALLGRAGRPSAWLTVEWLPKYAPELNDIGPIWRDLQAHIWRIKPSLTLTRSTGESTRPSPR
jgi:transposase